MQSCACMWQECITFCYNIALTTRSRPVGVFTPGADLLTPLEEFLNQIMPDNAHELATNRLYVSVTESETRQNEIVSTYSSKQELVQVSTHIRMSLQSGANSQIMHF